MGVSVSVLYDSGSSEFLPSYVVVEIERLEIVSVVFFFHVD